MFLWVARIDDFSESEFWWWFVFKLDIPLYSHLDIYRKVPSAPSPAPGQFLHLIQDIDGKDTSIDLKA